MLYTEEAARHNIRNRGGKRVFFLGKGDQLTASARDYLSRERIEILPASQAAPERYRLLSGGYLEEKPESMTHLNGDLLVPKNHPRIIFRGKMDSLESEILLCQLAIPHLEIQLEELLTLTRWLVRCDVLEEPVAAVALCGLTEEELRSHSHFPQDYYGQPHFMPSSRDGMEILRLNCLRCKIRETEIAAADAFPAGDRNDLIQALNRMSSLVYILMIREKAKRAQQ